VERCAAMKISNVVLVFLCREVVGVGFLDLWLEGKYEWIRYAMYSGRQSFYLRVGIDGWGGEWWEVLEVSRAATNSSQNLCLGWYIFGFCWLAFQQKVPSFLGTPKNCNNPLNSRGWSYKGKLWFFIRILEAVTGGSRCVVSLFFCFVKWNDGVKKTRFCDLCGLRDLHYQM
jgi:hypothetical protein